MKVIITTSGTGSRLDKITKYTNKSLVKSGDKLSIDYIIHNYKNYEDVEFIITIGYYGNLVKQYIEIAYKDKIKYRFVEIDNYDKIGSSLLYSLSKTQEFIQEPFIFHCCDTIITDSVINISDIESNILYVNDNNNSNQYATINVLDRDVLKINEKGEKIFDYIYIGLAYIKDYKFFWDKVNELLENQKNNSGLSDIHVYKAMIKNNIKINYEEIKNYYDIGNINSFDLANRNIKKNYNVIDKLTESISFLDDKVIKFFHDSNKNKKYVNRMNFIGVENIPRIYGYTDNFISMELINSKPLSEIYEYGLIKKLLDWTNINLWQNKLDIEIDNFRDTCYNFYYNKTVDRIKLFLERKNNIDFEIINNIKIKPIYELLKDIDFNELCDSNPGRYHGDFILDNILIKDGNFILIDWREDFGGCIEYGDMYYDLAKLKHNIYFNHKNILLNLFEINIKNKSECSLDMKCNYILIKQLQDFERFVKENNLNLRKINIIQSLIWINMAPLYDNPLASFLFNIGKFSLFLELNK